jgi:hypothetical protein
LSNQSYFVPSHNTKLILLVSKGPFGANEVCIWPFHQLPHLISFKVVQLLLHSHHPIQILKSLFYLGGSREETNEQNVQKFLR